MVDASHRIALHAQHSLGAQRGGAHDLRLQRKPVAVAAGNVHDRPDALLAGESHSRQRRHSRLAGVVVGQPDDIDGVSQNSDPITHPLAIGLGRQRNLRRREGSHGHRRIIAARRS